MKVLVAVTSLLIAAPAAGLGIHPTPGVQSIPELSGRAEITVVNPDRAALVALYEATDGPSWENNENWLSDRPLDEWYGVGVDTLGRVVSLDLSGQWNSTYRRYDHHGLKGAIPPELGQLSRLSNLSLGSNELEGEIPPELGNLANLHDLWLHDNQLTGGIPPELGNLASLRSLFLHNNQLTGEIPSELGNLVNLSSLYLYDNQFTGQIPSELGNPSKLFRLFLSDNQLTGGIPPELGNLADLNAFGLSQNQLTGEIPQEFSQLSSLGWLRFDDNAGLCASGTPLIVDWLDQLQSQGPFCNEVDIEVLSGLFETSDGDNWTESDGWLESNALERWHGVEADSSGHVVSLDLRANELSGGVSSALGRLHRATVLRLDDNNLTGRLPGSLTGLALTELSYTGTELCVPTDEAFQGWPGSNTVHRGTQSGCEPISDREILGLFYLATGGANWTRNEGWLTDRPLGDWHGIEVNEMGQVTGIDLANNNLAGEIPLELGQSSSLERLSLFGNRLTGSIPPELGQISGLWDLDLSSNQLTGSIPQQLGDLSFLATLRLSSNNGLVGALPLSLAKLNNLERLQAPGTMLCAPADEAFQAWLNGIESRRVSDCPLADFYLTQVVQSREFPVPLVAGEPALLRVFVTAPYETSETLPPVRARFFHSGAEVHVAEIPRGSRPIPLELYEGDLGLSANVEIPGEAIQEGLEVVIEVDPDGVVDPALGVRRRIPEAGRMAVEVSAMPRLDLTLIPFVQTGDQDSSIVETVRTMTEGPEEHRLLAGTRYLLPVADMSVTAHELVLTSSDRGRDVLSQADALRSMEDGSGYYVGMMTNFSDRGVAYTPGWVSASEPSWLPNPIAHKLAHNMSLFHAPCGYRSGVDSSYSYEYGNTGAWGFDWETEELVSPSQQDLMSYCYPQRISDYHFSKALRYRLSAEGAAHRFAASPQARTLLVWGGVDADGVPYLDPAFVVDATPAVPPPGNTYTLTARTVDGGIAFSYTFDMPEVVDDGRGRSSFVFTIPAEDGWATGLASITLSGPGGTAELDGETDDPMVILREGEGGQVRGFLRGEEAVAALAPGQVAAYGLRQDTQALFSRGLPRN